MRGSSWQKSSSREFSRMRELPLFCLTSLIVFGVVTVLCPERTFAAEKAVFEFSGRTAGELQTEMSARTGQDCCIRLSKGFTLTCPVREDEVAGEVSRHALLIPENIELDLNDGTLVLDLRSNSYGVRLSSHSVIRNGTIRVERSEGKGSQSCWHSGISVGAAYGDGGTPEKPGHFVTVAHWKIENITIEQKFEAAAVQLMSEACFGVIRNVRIMDSDAALLGIGMDWGSVGPMTSEDAQIPRMKSLWKAGQIYSTHPHDVIVENIRVGKLLRNKDANDAGIRCSACHRITIRNVDVESAACAVSIWGGDCGYEFARPDFHDDAHSGYVIENVTIHRAMRFGLVMNGSADNVYRAQRDYQYEVMHDPVHPGLNRPLIRNMQLNGPVGTENESVGSQGLYAVGITGAEIDGLKLSRFSLGVHVEDWVQGMTFRNTMLTENTRDIAVEGATEPATGVIFETQAE
jgi:hypothetical protein